MIDVKITEEQLLISDIEACIQDDSTGGLVCFIGSVRDNTGGKEVTHLEFETYESMAIKEMHKIAALACKKYNVIHLAIHHRVGRLGIGEYPVIIGVSCPHRKAAFEACEFAINALKETVPIWKREYFVDGSVWVSATP